jgi:ketosteroid isomerase-like protein
MDENKAIIKAFYAAFQQRDYKAMQAAYHDTAVFSDPVFQGLKAPEVRAMWQMLITSATDMKITCGNITAQDDTVQCTWQAWYTFSATGRGVHNIIHATFVFRDGKILRHTDRFNFWRWSRMALGTPGLLLGWSPLLVNKVRGQARKRLNGFLEKNNIS